MASFKWRAEVPFLAAAHGHVLADGTDRYCRGLGLARPAVVDSRPGRVPVDGRHLRSRGAYALRFTPVVTVTRSLPTEVQAEIASDGGRCLAGVATEGAAV